MASAKSLSRGMKAIESGIGEKWRQQRQASAKARWHQWRKWQQRGVNHRHLNNNRVMVTAQYRESVIKSWQ